MKWEARLQADFIEWEDQKSRGEYRPPGEPMLLTHCSNAQDPMPRTDRPAILVVDDDVEMTEMLCEYLDPEGFVIEVCHDGDTGLKLALQPHWQLIVLDVMLPRLNGFEVLRRLRASSQVPVIMLTARGDAIDRVVGLQGGADDYLPKPFDPQEFVARVKAILRRTAPSALRPHEDEDVVALADVTLDSRARTVRRGGAHVELTSAEFALLRVFLRAAGRVLTREELFREVLDREFSVFDRSIDNHVSSLRKKLGARPDGRERIRSVRNAGYIYPLDETGADGA
ncbi:response regulator transcription factor [Paludibaculum fermentans]|uniref:response regulator transcription factor n=1 Tax=Paludibaculum fermentans TaxID=1473598 RepID=UPI003EBCEB10